MLIFFVDSSVCILSFENTHCRVEWSRWIFLLDQPKVAELWNANWTFVSDKTWKWQARKIVQEKIETIMWFFACFCQFHVGWVLFLMCRDFSELFAHRYNLSREFPCYWIHFSHF